MYNNQKDSFNIIHCWIIYGKYKCPFSGDDTFENVLQKESKSFHKRQNVGKLKYIIAIKSVVTFCKIFCWRIEVGVCYGNGSIGMMNNSMK